ncbi:MAG: TetR/AcrR family transcriptional regulator [Thermomicrobiales bacterium]|nr:TetR/AcrR family transcriptional regulator [Thermomicrobiales bacterium]
MNQPQMPETRRSYRMEARAAQAEQTHQRILRSMVDLFSERWVGDISLADVAARSDVTVQTVLRRFGSKEGLIAAAGEALRQQIEAQRGQAPVGDVDGAVANLVEHYEDVGDIALRALAQEGTHASIRVLTDRGRQVHYQWVDRTFAPWLEKVADNDRATLRAQIIAITDVYVWKVMRRDLQLSRGQVESALADMLNGVLAATSR